jgi:hypothetical protein
MGGLLQFLPFLVIAFVVISIIRNAVKVVRKLNETPVSRSPATFDPAEAERTRRIQEEIRRKIAERRGNLAPLEPMRRIEPVMERTAEPENPPAPPPLSSPTEAELERQQQLADQMRTLEAARLMEQRKAAAVAATVQSETERAAAVLAMRGALLADLRSRPTARRAMLLREILDRPVALR